MQIFKYDITDSTNERAREYARSEGAHFPAVFIARGQTHGRGRRGRSFDSELGAGLYISFLIKEDTKADEAVKITARAAVATSRAIERTSGLSPEIKWVNDIYSRGRKLAGILTEGEIDTATGRLSYAVCGIGINLKKRDFPDELSDIATTVEDECGITVDSEVLAEVLAEEFFSVGDYMNEYRERSLVLGKKIAVRRLTGEEFTAHAVEITETASLIVEKENGEREELSSAEVSVSEKCKKIQKT